MPPHLEKVRDKLAENIHELWGMNKIELGWTYGKVRRTGVGTVTKSLIHTVMIMSVAEINIAVEPSFIYRTLSQAAAANALVVSTY